MAHTKSAKKWIRKSREQRLRNRSVTSAVKTQIGKADGLIAEGQMDPAREAVAQAMISLDRAARKGIIHSNNAARRKSRLMKRFNTAFPSQA